MNEMHFIDRDQPGLDPGQVYGRGALAPPVTDQWLIRRTGKPPIQVRGLPGIETTMPRSRVVWVWPPASQIAGNIGTALLPDAMAGIRIGLPEPGD